MIFYLFKILLHLKIREMRDVILKIGCISCYYSKLFRKNNEWMDKLQFIN